MASRRSDQPHGRPPYNGYHDHDRHRDYDDDDDEDEDGHYPPHHDHRHPGSQPPSPSSPTTYEPSIDNSAQNQPQPQEWPLSSATPLHSPALPTTRPSHAHSESRTRSYHAHPLHPGHSRAQSRHAQGQQPYPTGEQNPFLARDEDYNPPRDYTSPRTGSSMTERKQPPQEDLHMPLDNKKPKKQKGRIAKVSWKDRFREKIQTWFRILILETILRQTPLPPTVDGRHVPLNPTGVGPDGLVDERSGKPYISNFIRSSRYTPWNFIPGQLIFQFSKLGNFYFLVIGTIQMIPGLSTVGSWTTIGPLGVFVAFSIAKEGYDDYRRYLLDKVENTSTAWVLAHGVREGHSNPSEKAIRRKQKKEMKKQRKSAKGKRRGEDGIMRDIVTGQAAGLGDDSDWMPVQWQHVQVGDVLRLGRDDNVPADIVLLNASGPNGIAYIETIALDGETNLKSKQACTLLAKRCNSMEGLRACQGVVISEDPNLDLYSFDGRVKVDGETLPLTLNNVIYRGSTVRNTNEVIGLVINTGEECKIRMNANKNVRAKKPAIQSNINRMVMYQIIIACCLGGGLTGGYYLWLARTGNNAFYIIQPGAYDARVSFTEIFFGFLIMFNTLIPLSLYISMEIIKIGQVLLLMDADMYDPVSDTPMVANTMTILENLGQVSWVFTDKTGTLTENLMRFRKLSVAGVACLHDMDVDRDEATKLEKIQSNQAAKGMRPNPGLVRSPTGGSIARWRSSVQRKEDLPEMKTEDLLRYIQRNPNSPFSRRAKQFILCIALCHTALPETKDDGEITFQAASPDELALVDAARDMGYLVIDRPAQSIVLQTSNPDGSTHNESYQVLDVIEFSSKRKRMSIIIRMPDGRICVFCKGADNVIMERLRLKQVAAQKFRDVNRRTSIRKTVAQDGYRNSMTLSRSDSDQLRLSFGNRNSYSDVLNILTRGPTEDSDYNSPNQGSSSRGDRMQSYESPDVRVNEAVADNDAAIFEHCFQHIERFAAEGLRTLLYSYRYVDDEEYTQWKKIYREAETSLVDRQMRIEEASEKIEQGFELAGATAIEDKLQDGVPETIDKLRRANIKVWMLTGDKRETAINIGHSARVCKPYSEVFVLDVDEGNLQHTLDDIFHKVQHNNLPHTVVVIDGKTLQAVDDDEHLAAVFYDLTILIDSVICCRASPSQKSHLVRSVRRYVPGSMTLAIGDGANDIGMIQESHVGIGISGREGLQASRISDYSIAQFRFLQKLLFVHGRWNYIRTCKYVLATFWKEMVFFLVQAHFQAYNGYTGTSMYEEWSLTVFNVFFTSLPVIILGIFEKDLQAETLLAAPELYRYGQEGRGFSYYHYLWWMTMGTGCSFATFYIMWGAYDMALFDNDTSMFAIGVICFSASVIYINIKLLILEMHSKTIITALGLIISVGGWFLWNMILSAAYREQAGAYVVRHGFIDNFGRQLLWWATLLLALTVLIVAELVVQAIRRVYFPSDEDLMQRVEKDSIAQKKLQDKALAAERGETDGIELRELIAESEATKRQRKTEKKANRGFMGKRPNQEQRRQSYASFQPQEQIREDP